MVPTFAFLDLHHRHPGITCALAACLGEAARVCLERHHSPPVKFLIDNSGAPGEVTARWEPCDERARRAWANDIDATEYAAYCLALAAVEVAAGLVAVGRAETSTGADYYLGLPSDDLDDFEFCYRLEVSGVDRGGLAEIRSRLRSKISQAARTESNVPAIACVVGLAIKIVILKEVQPT